MKMNSSVRVLLTAIVFTASAVDLHSGVVADLRAVALDAAGDATPASGAIPGRRPMMRRARFDRATASASGIYPNDPLSEGYANALERGSESEARQEPKQAIDNETVDAFGSLAAMGAGQRPRPGCEPDVTTGLDFCVIIQISYPEKWFVPILCRTLDDAKRQKDSTSQHSVYVYDKKLKLRFQSKSTQQAIQDGANKAIEKTKKAVKHVGNTAKKVVGKLKFWLFAQEEGHWERDFKPSTWRSKEDECKTRFDRVAEEQELAAQAEKERDNAKEAEKKAKNSENDAKKSEEDAKKQRREAERAKLKAEKETSKAKAAEEIAEAARRNASELAKKEKSNAERLEVEKHKATLATEQAIVEKACAAFLTRQVRTEISCVGNGEGTFYTVKAPGGVMLSGNPVQAYRCTNAGACLDERQWVGIRSGAACQDPSNCCRLGTVSQSSAVMCRIGYDPNSPGCNRCDQGYGRASADPFVCEECGNPGLQWAVFGIMPSILFVVSFRGATAQRAGGIFNDLMKIFLSFGSGSSVVMSAVVASKSYPELPVGLQEFLGAGDKSTKAGSAVYSASLDCLMGSTATIGDMLSLSLAAPLAIFLMSCIFLTVRNVLSFSSRPLLLDIVLMSLVLGNQFLPTIVGASMRALPCIHMQKSGGGAVRNHLLAYDVDVECEDRPSHLLMVMVGACTVAFFSGPYYWWWLLSKRQPDTQAIAQPDPAESSDGGDLDAVEASCRADTAAGEETVTGGPVEETPAQEVPSQIGPDEENKCGEAGEGGGGSAASEMPVDGAATDNAAMPEINSSDVAFAVEKEGYPVISETAWESTLGFLTGNYRPEIRTWESWVLLRKIALSVVSTLAPMSYSAGQHIIQALLILLVSLVAHFFAWPYKAEKNLLNIVEGVSLTVLNLALVLAVYVSIDIWSSTAFSRQLATVAAGTLLVANFYTLIGFMIWAKWKDAQEPSENHEETT